MQNGLTATRSSRVPHMGFVGSLSLLIALIVAILGVAARAQGAKPSVDQVQAAYLYNFGKFVKWPASAAANESGAFIVCVLNPDPFGDTLQTVLAGETIAGKPVVVKRLAKAQDAVACHVLFIGADRARDLPGILSSINEAAVLTVSDMPDFSKRGGMIQFVMEGNRIRFEINLAGAEKSRLVFPSDLLKVAVAVHRAARPGE